MTRPRAKPAKRKRSRIWRFGLQAVFVLLILSGVLRFGDAAWGALAESGHTASEATGAGECVTDEAVLAMMSELTLRETRLDAREASQAARDQAMRTAEGHLEARLAELKAAEAELARTIAIADRGAEDDVSHLVALYESMKPKEAAPLFEEMAPDFAAGFLARMRPDAAAGVLAALDPKTGYAISVLLAGRNADAPRN
ncbi:MotE family protein [Pseudothioclava arenosa]|uniref:Magnesium transporter MgtE intracellular domain-containing protein n=1 Tax=Pseudothioclava arenosa TaxID=1795308 RepID=A0A2A4CNT2_9RHOB|nr:hypothetical protein [Pseudothioclava arenosa]PCD75922.1 hypothetical protein CLN94_12270 [Pseudothioclava arenosa]